MHVGSWCRNMEEICRLEDLGIDGSTILIRIFKKWVGKHGLSFSVSRYGQVAGYCECGTEPAGSLIYEEFLD